MITLQTVCIDSFFTSGGSLTKLSVPGRLRIKMINKMLSPYTLAFDLCNQNSMDPVKEKLMLSIARCLLFTFT